LIATGLTATALIAGGALALHSWAWPRHHPVSIAAPRTIPAHAGARPIGKPTATVLGLSRPVRITAPSPLQGRAPARASHPLAHIIQGQPPSRSGGSGPSKPSKGANPSAVVVKSSHHSSAGTPRGVRPVSARQKVRVTSRRAAAARTGVGVGSPTHRLPVAGGRARATGYAHHRPATAGHRTISHAHPVQARHVQARHVQARHVQARHVQAPRTQPSHARMPHVSIAPRTHVRHARAPVRTASAHPAHRRGPSTSPCTTRPVGRTAIRRHQPVPTHRGAKRPHHSPVAHRGAKHPHRSPAAHRGAKHPHRPPAACYWRTIPGRPVYAGRRSHGRTVIVMIRRQPSRRVFWCGGRHVVHTSAGGMSRT